MDIKFLVDFPPHTFIMWSLCLLAPMVYDRKSAFKMTDDSVYMRRVTSFLLLSFFSLFPCFSTIQYATIAAYRYECL